MKPERCAEKVLRDIREKTNRGRMSLNKGGYVSTAARELFPSIPFRTAIYMVYDAIKSPICKEHVKDSNGELKYYERMPRF